MKKVLVRQADRGDTARIIELIRGLAEYEKAPEQAVAKVEDIDHALFQAQPRVHALMSEVDGKAVGFALYFFNFSTWTGKSGVYLEDLYVEPEFRGYGAGKALLKEVARIAVAQDCARFEWSVLDWNEPAIRFYEAFGARPQTEWVGYRLTGQALRDFAESDD